MKKKEFSFIRKVAVYCGRLVIALPPELYDKLPKGTKLQIVVKKI